LEVADNGPGIVSEHSGKSFDRFYRVDEPRSRGPCGAGLELSIAQWAVRVHGGDKLEFVVEFISAILAALRGSFRGRRDSALEIPALRQQLAVFKRKNPAAGLSPFDRLFWTILRRLWSGWAGLVKPETVVRWHRAGFRFYWRWRSRAGGRPKITVEIRAMISRIAAENAPLALGQAEADN
jgi:hypothetical protein